MVVVVSAAQPAKIAERYLCVGLEEIPSVKNNSEYVSRGYLALCSEALKGNPVLKTDGVGFEQCGHSRGL